jgi:excisionase family DNA binding protein
MDMRQIAVRANNAAAPQPPDMQGQQLTEWLTAKEAAQHLKVKTRTMLLWVRQGKVKGYALSGTRRRVWRFLRSDLNAMLTEPSVPCGQGAQ